jgi:hypothetical protein
MYRHASANFADTTMAQILGLGGAKNMPVYGKKASPQDMIGSRIVDIEHRIDRGEHQMWFFTDFGRFIFFEPIYCCDAVTIDHYSLVEDAWGKTIESISFDKGLYTFKLRSDSGKLAEWFMQWISVKKFHRIGMVKLSRQL